MLAGAGSGKTHVITHLQEERRLMYIGITRAQRSLAVSWTRKCKKGREKLKTLRAEFAQKALDGAAARALVK